MDIITISRAPHHMGSTSYSKGWKPSRWTNKYAPHYGKKETAKAIASGRFNRLNLP